MDRQSKILFVFNLDKNTVEAYEPNSDQIISLDDYFIRTIVKNMMPSYKLVKRAE